MAIGAGVSRHPRLLALGAGFAGATGFAPLGLWPVALLACALLIALVARSRSIGQAALIGWLFGVGHFTLGLNWIAGSFAHQDVMPAWLGYIAVVLLSLYLAAYTAFSAGLARALGTGNGLAFVLVFASSWIVGETLRATLFTGFAWNPLGSIFVPTWVAGWARLVGTYGLSGVAMLASGAIVLATASRRAWAPGLAFAAIVAGGGWLILRPDPGTTRTVVRIVQPNISLDEGRDAFAARAGIERLAALTGRPGTAPRLVFWPEGVLHDVYQISYDPSVAEELATLLGPKDLLLLGATRIEYRRTRDASGVGTDWNAVGARNSMFLVDAKGRVRERYDKAHLVPYGEYLPMRTLLTPIGLARLVPGDLDFWPGPGPRTLALPSFGKGGIQICYEIIFSGQVVDRRDRPAFIFNGSIDAWFGAWGPPQHLAQARLRAIEEGLPIVRSTTTGISALIDSRGTVIEAIPMNRPGFIEARLPAALAPTPFAQFGNVLPLGFALLLGAGGVALGRKRR